MPSFNKVILMGNLARDPELMQTKNGTSICRFTVAVNRSFSAQDGSLRDETCFVEMDSFGRTAENISKYFNKGKPILVEGRLRQDSWEDKQTGQKRSKLLVVVERFEFVSSGTRNGAPDGVQQSQPDYGGAQQQQRAPRQPAPSTDETEDDDVPF